MLKIFRLPLALGCLVLLDACSPVKKVVTAPPVPVEVASVIRQNVPLDLPAIGAAEPVATVQLKPRVLGQITAVHFADGDSVKEGDILFSIDPRPFDVAVTKARANLQAVKAGASNASGQLQRYSSLTGQGAASKEQLDQYRATATSTASDLLSRQADLDDALLSREWTEVKAPISGRIGAALVKVGNIVQANTSILAVINQIQPIHLAFSLPETDLPSLRQAVKNGGVTVLANDPNSGKEIGSGTLDFIDNAVDRETGTIGLKALLKNEDETIWPGQFVDLAVRLEDDKDQIVVPTTAITDTQNGTQVLVVVDNKVALRKVEVVRTWRSLSVIRKGLESGEKIITSGQLRVSPGSQVVPKEIPIDAPALGADPKTGAAS